MPKFLVKYKKYLSTWRNDYESDQEDTMEFDKQPTRKDFPGIERMLEDRFLRMFGKHKNLAHISYKVKKVVPVS